MSQLQVLIMENARPVRDVALSADVSTETLINIAKLPNRNMVRQLLDRPSLPSEVYDVLLSREPAVLLLVAKSVNTPPDVLERLKNNADARVREAAGQVRGS